MKIPETVRIINTTYTIQIVNDPKLNGWIDTENAIIYLVHQGSKMRVFETLLHEISHGINEVANIDTGCTEEEFVTRTTPMWLAVWKDNPQLLALLTESVNW